MRPGSVTISPQNMEQFQQLILLREGQIVKAEVAEIKGKKLLLKIGATLLTAQTRVPLQRGENLQLLVESHQNNIIKLKIIPEGETIKPETVMLLRLGLKPLENLEHTAQQLLKFKMPVAKEILNEVSSVIKTANLPKEILPLVVWLKSVGLNLDTKADLLQLTNLLQFFKGKLSLQQEGKFFRLLNESESMILGGYNIYGWSIARQHLYLLTSNSKEDNISPDRCTVIIKATSKAFDELWFKLHYLENILNVSITCTTEEHKKILAEEVALLQKGLRLAGYGIGEIKVETGKVTTVFDLVPVSLPETKGVNCKI